MWFSALERMPTTGTGNSSFATAYIIPSTAIAPHLSKIIRPIFSAGLIEMPPVSKVIALPTTSRGEPKDEGGRLKDEEDFWRLPSSFILLPSALDLYSST